MIAAIPFIQKLRLLLVVLACLLATPAFATTVVEFYNTNLDNYFITADANEAAQIDSGSAGAGWSRTGNSFSSGGSTSVCRFYGSQSPGPNSHFYTVDASECAGLKLLQASTPDTQKRWNFESLDFVSTPPTGGTCPGGTVPVYRAYNNGNSRGIDSNHRITSSTSAIQEVVDRGWNNEGVVMCAPVALAFANGACGSANGVSVSSSPTSGYCSAGTQTSVTGSGPWYWSCSGSNGGTSASCSAPKTAVAPTTAGYISQGGRTWMPVSSTRYTYAQATALCAGTINGQSGWRLPTKDELIAFYKAYPNNSSVLRAQGWALYETWSSTPNGSVSHYVVSLYYGYVNWYKDTYDNYVTCVR